MCMPEGVAAYHVELVVFRAVVQQLLLSVGGARRCLEGVALLGGEQAIRPSLVLRVCL